MSTPGVVPTDTELEQARSSWATDVWNDHFRGLGQSPANRARYAKSSSATAKPSTTPHNDVIKMALFSLSKGRCWFQGGGCRSRAVSPRDAQIDHIIPKSATGSQLRSALASSGIQKAFFDVHDPGNLAYICGPCNLTKGKYILEFAAAQLERSKAEERRGDVINLVDEWYAGLDIEAAGLGLASMDISDPAVQEMYTEHLIDMILNLDKARGGAGSMMGYNDVSVKTSLYNISVEPSEDTLEAEIESQAEMAADDARGEARHGL